MKNQIEKIVSILIVSSILISCNASSYFQVLKTEVENGKMENNLIVFEDENCIINYALWASGGNIGFKIYNKTNKILRVDLSKTFFVLNGTSYQYFQI